MVIAVVAMVSMLGALSLVIDAGVYFVIKRQLQSAADAAALAAVWYDPACDSTKWAVAGCQPSTTEPIPNECTQAPNNSPANNLIPCTVAVNTVKANWSVAMSLCAGPNQPTGATPVNISAHPGLPPNFAQIVVPNVTPYVVTLDCEAPHWFARVLPGVKLTMDINANSAAALGWLGDNGQIRSDPRPTPTTPLVARLIL